MAIFIPAIGAVGYLLLSDLLESKQRQDERLEHMTREVLHEINLPISTIETNIQMLQHKLTDEKDTKRIERIKGSTKRLKRLYDTLMYSIKREINGVEKEEFDLAEVVGERIAVYEEMGRNSFEAVLVSHRVKLDKIGLEQVLDNIFENSMKYSHPDKPITVELSGGKLTVTDKGVGMDRGQIARIYERYYQGDSHSQGEGIGLALVKRYCDESGIRVKITSKPKEGTEVTLDFD
jgi:signal transduction histidine kinase